MLAASSSTWSPSDESIVKVQAQMKDYEYHTWHVYVQNEMSQPEKILIAHCKSADDDLGIRNLTVGSQFEWKFKLALFGSTLFWCHMASDFGHASFDVFKEDHELYYKCNYKFCHWIAKDDGIYLKNVPENYDEFRYKWEQGRLVVVNSTI